jgi:hypothetical protein
MNYGRFLAQPRGFTRITPDEKNQAAENLAVELVER